MNKSIEMGRAILSQSVAIAVSDHTEDVCETVAEWLVSCEIGAYVPDDGDAFWATEFKAGDDCAMMFVSDVPAWSYPAPSWATHVLFYGK